MSFVYKSASTEEDLVNIWLYSYQQWGEAQADHYLDSLDAALDLLADTPLICREREEFTPPVRIHLHNHHLIVYQVIDNGINIIRVLHKSMNIDEQLEV